MTQILVPVPKTPLGTVQKDASGALVFIVSREWYRYFSLLREAVGGSTNVIVEIDTTTSPDNPGDTQAVSAAAFEADSYASQNAGAIEELGAKFDGLDPQIPGPVEFTQLARALEAQTPFGMPPTELGALEAAKNSGYRIAAAGNATLVAGTATVNSLNALATNQFLLTAKAVGGSQGFLSIGTVTANTSFVINSSNVADTSTVSWAILKPIGG